MVLGLGEQILAGVGLDSGHLDVEAVLVTVDRQILEVSVGD